MGVVERSPVCTLVLVLLVASTGLAWAAQGRRVVDVVKVGDPASEREHEYAGEDVTRGVEDGRVYRQPGGWLRYSLTVYEDTEVTLACTFLGSSGRRLTFDLLVDGQTILSPTFVSPSAAPVAVDYTIPFRLTKGKTVISVTLRATGGPTPRLIELRTVQEHLEIETGARGQGSDPHGLGPRVSRVTIGDRPPGP
jgi:hypothetical protein